MDFYPDTLSVQYDNALFHPQPINPYAIPTTFPTPSELAATSSSEPPRKSRRVYLADPPPLPEQSLLIPPSDGISSHEKKRHYLECLEQYVMFLHQQLLLVGLQPIALERSTSNSRGMTSKSIRVCPSLSFPFSLFICSQTLLVHMKHMNQQLNIQTISEEERVRFHFPLNSPSSTLPSVFESSPSRLNFILCCS